MKTTKMLWREGLKHLTPLKHKEFICPVCGGIATANQSGEIVAVECHACGRRATDKVTEVKL